MKKRLFLKKMVIASLNDKEKANVLGGACTQHTCGATCNWTVCVSCGGCPNTH